MIRITTNSETLSLSVEIFFMQHLLLMDNLYEILTKNKIFFECIKFNFSELNEFKDILLA